MQYWPRKRSRRPTPRVRSSPESKEAKITGFAGYKAGMTHITYIDEDKNSISKNDEVVTPVTIIECPPVMPFSVRFYKNEADGNRIVKEVSIQTKNKDLKKRLRVPKTKEADLKEVPEHDEVRLLVSTQPKLAGFGKKKPDVFEVVVGGNKEAQLEYAKANLGKEIPVKDIFNEGDIIDLHGITKGKGYQGPVKRFGVKIQRPKKEKIKRGPGARSGGWTSQGHMMYRVATAGQMGYHQRKECNKQIVKISENPKEVNPKGGLVNYGQVKSTFMLVTGSVMGPKKRFIRLSPASRNHINRTQIVPNYISTESKQRK